MPTHQPLVPCTQNKVIRKFIRDVPCPKMKPKKKREIPCPAAARKRCSKQVEEVTCSNRNRVQPAVCPAKQQESAPKCVQSPVCPGKERKVTGCPKCESNRIQKLECEVSYDFARIDQFNDLPRFNRGEFMVGESRYDSPAHLFSRVKHPERWINRLLDQYNQPVGFIAPTSA